MAPTRETLRQKLVPGSGSEPSKEELLDALDGRIDEDGEVLYHLPGSGPLVRESDDGDDRFGTGAGDRTAAVVTDRQLLLVATGRDGDVVKEIPYTEIRRVDGHDGLLRSKLAVAVWNEGEYRLGIGDASELGAAMQYLREASDCWDRVIAAVEDAYDRIAGLGEQLQEGNLGQAREQREAARTKIERARSYVDRADIEATGPLSRRIAEAERELARTEIRARIARAETMISEGAHQTDAREYTEAYRNLWYARDHLETALSVARKHDLREPAEVEPKLETIETRLARLEVKPRALAEQACERAMGTDSLRTEIDAWQEAFEHYRDALTAGWGTELDFSGDTEEFRFKTELVVNRLIEARCERAGRLETEAESLLDEQPDTAARRYEAALDHLDAAHDLAAEFRSGDADRIARERDRLRARRRDLSG